MGIPKGVVRSVVAYYNSKYYHTRSISKTNILNTLLKLFYNTGTEVTFKRQDSKDSLTFWKKGDYVEYEMSCVGQNGRRRRLLQGGGTGNC